MCVYMSVNTSCMVIYVTSFKFTFHRQTILDINILTFCGLRTRHPPKLIGYLHRGYQKLHNFISRDKNVWNSWEESEAQTLLMTSSAE